MKTMFIGMFFYLFIGGRGDCVGFINFMRKLYLHYIIYHKNHHFFRCGRTGRAGNKGWAFTFITNDQPKFAGEVIRAMELSDTPVPEEIKV